MSQTNEILAFLATLIAGGIIGFILCHLTLGKKNAAVQQQALDENKAELDEYKAKVKNHFSDSAELMGQVASSYQALYSHMAGQSQSLLKDQDNTLFPILDTPDEEDLDLAITETEDEVTPAESIFTEEKSDDDVAVDKTESNQAESDNEQQTQDEQTEAEKSAATTDTKIDDTEQPPETDTTESNSESAEQAEENKTADEKKDK